MNTRYGKARFVAGLQAGMAGALVLLGWMALSMVWARHSPWWFPNLMATPMGGEAALRNSFGRFTSAGIASVLLQYSLLGGLLAWLIPESTLGTRLVLFGIMTGLGFYYLMFFGIWRHYEPLMALYSPDRQLVVGHILYGLMLGRLGRYSDRD